MAERILAAAAATTIPAKAAEPLNLKRIEELTADLHRTAVDAFDENADASRQLALLQSICTFVRSMPVRDANDPYTPPQVTWTCAMLEMLEDCAYQACGMDTPKEAPALELIYKAISRLQEVLGVPADKRAWVFEDSPPPKEQTKQVALFDLPGEMGERARLAWEAAVNTQQSAGALLELLDIHQDPIERDRVVKNLLRNISNMAGVVLSCTTDDDTIENLRERAGCEAEAS
jgi:hypothetical protein